MHVVLDLTESYDECALAKFISCPKKFSSALNMIFRHRIGIYFIT